jgi:hypothetical protein
MTLPEDLSDTMLRGLFDGYQEGAGKGAWVFHRVDLSPRRNGSEITHTPFFLPIPNILCQTFRMKNLPVTICLILWHKGKVL